MIAIESPDSQASFVGRYGRGMLGQLDEAGSRESAVRMRLPWAQGLERPPVVILLDPPSFCLRTILLLRKGSWDAESR